MDAVLVVGAGILPTFLMHEAQAMGLYVMATDDRREAPGVAVADEHHPISPYNPEKHAVLALELRDNHQYRLRGVCTAGADVAPSVAAAADAAGLPGIPRVVARQTHDKAMVRAALSTAGLALYQPAWLCYHQAVADADHRIGYPCVVKPLSQRASRGLTIVQHPDALQDACHKALTYGDDYLIEECLMGSEHSAEAIVGDDGTLVWFNIVDRMFSYKDGLAIETGHVNPTRLGAQAQQRIQLMLVAAARALGVTWGPFKVDVMLTTEGPKILEVTARLSGGFDCQRTSPMTGRNPMRQLLQLACGYAVDPQPAPTGAAACAAILPSGTGILQGIPVRGKETIWLTRPGAHVSPATHNAERIGFVLVPHEDPEEAWRVATTEAHILASVIDTQLLTDP